MSCGGIVVLPVATKLRLARSQSRRAAWSRTSCQTTGAKVSAVVYNGGALVAKWGVTVDFYAVLDNGQTAHIGQGVTANSLKPGDSETVTVPWPSPPQQQSVKVKAVVDEKELIGDCHLENNTVTTANAVKCTPLG